MPTAQSVNQFGQILAQLISQYNQQQRMADATKYLNPNPAINPFVATSQGGVSTSGTQQPASTVQPPLAPTVTPDVTNYSPSQPTFDNEAIMRALIAQGTPEAQNVMRGLASMQPQNVVLPQGAMLGKMDKFGGGFTPEVINPKQPSDQVKDRPTGKTKTEGNVFSVEYVPTDIQGNPIPGAKPYWKATQASSGASGGAFQKLTDSMGKIVGWVKPGSGQVVTTKDLGVDDIIGTPVSSTTKTMIETAPKVKDLVNKINQEIDQQETKLGPAVGRWNNYMTGTVGANDPGFNQLRVNTGLLSTLLMRMHVGARGSEKIMDKFDNLIGLGAQSPDNLRAAMAAISSYADDVEGQGKTLKPSNESKFKILKVE